MYNCLVFFIFFEPVQEPHIFGGSGSWFFQAAPDLQPCFLHSEDSKFLHCSDVDPDPLFPNPDPWIRIQIKMIRIRIQIIQIHNTAALIPPLIKNTLVTIE